MPVPNTVAADSKTLDDADDTHLGDGGLPAAAWCNSEGLLGSKGMRRDNIRVRMVAVTR
jgi:hypothetical protein